MRRSGLPLVTVGFGGLGEAVCALEGEAARWGVPQEPLPFDPDAPFWQPCAQAAPGEWRVWRLGGQRGEDRRRRGLRLGVGQLRGLLPPASIADVARLAGVADPPAAGSVDGAPSATVKTVYPAGVAPERGGARQGVGIYAAAAAILTLTGAGALYAARRARRREPRG